MSVLHMTIESETLAHVAAPNRFKDFWRHGSQLSAVSSLGTFPRSGRCALQADRGWPARRDRIMRKEFACPVCDSPAIVYPEEGEEDRIVCGGCGAFVATRDQFRRFIEQHAEVQTSGC
jgi:hypothetical protein